MRRPLRPQFPAALALALTTATPLAAQTPAANTTPPPGSERIKEVPSITAVDPATIKPGQILTGTIDPDAGLDQMAAKAEQELTDLGYRQ